MLACAAGQRHRRDADDVGSGAAHQPREGVVIDVSEPAEFEQEHVAGARNVPFGQLDGHKQLPSNKALPWWWCARWRTCRAVAVAASGWLRKRAQALTGGTRAWREAIVAGGTQGA